MDLVGAIISQLWVKVETDLIRLLVSLSSYWLILVISGARVPHRSFFSPSDCGNCFVPLYPNNLSVGMCLCVDIPYYLHLTDGVVVVSAQLVV